MRILILMTMVLGLSACGSKSSVGQNTIQSKNLMAVTYYAGGWIPTPGQPNWAHDMTADFSKYSNSQYEVRAKIPSQPNCVKIGGITLDQTREFIALYGQMTLLPATSPPVVDAGAEYVELTYDNGEKVRYYLRANSAPIGQYYISSPDPIRNFLINLESSLLNLQCP